MLAIHRSKPCSSNMTIDIDLGIDKTADGILDLGAGFAHAQD